MPVYEFACNACGAQVSVFVRSFSSPVAARCKRCDGSDLRRLISRVTVIRSSGSLADDSMLDSLDESDPRAMAAMARRMRAEMGEDAGPEFDEMIDRLERGESLEEDFGDEHEHDDDF